jgi:hypothetical protein
MMMMELSSLQQECQDTLFRWRGKRSAEAELKLAMAMMMMMMMRPMDRYNMNGKW